MELYRMRLLPKLPGQGHLVHAHIEAHDHLALVEDLHDGSVQIAGPADRAGEIRAVASEIARALGALLIEG